MVRKRVRSAPLGRFIWKIAFVVSLTRFSILFLQSVFSILVLADEDSEVLLKSSPVNQGVESPLFLLSEMLGSMTRPGIENILKQIYELVGLVL